MENSFNDIDSLVLSVIHEHNQIDLVKWIGIIDFYERIILTLDELSASLEKLQKNGLVQLSNNNFSLSSEAINFFPKKFTLRNYEKIYNKLSKKDYTEIAERKMRVIEFRRLPKEPVLSNLPETWDPSAKMPPIE